MSSPRTQWLIFAAVVAVALLAISGYKPYDRETWLMEVIPALVILPVLVFTYYRFPLTTLLYALIFVHACVLMIGGKYTYARVPLGFDIAELLGWSRNPYDKIGHFFQGFVPALAAREILIRGNYVRTRRMLSFLVICVVMMISVTYEFIEWWTALAIGQDADAFLGTQGDPWDTQSDMFFALIGGTVALLFFSGVHDRQIQHVVQAHS